MSRPPNVELREFLRSRRARVTPAAAGLPPHPGGRRVPGLRREEVAQLAGVSMDYYVRLERGRTANVSESVLDAVARALQLNELERSHLFTLAKPGRARPRALPAQQVRPGLQLVVDSITDLPALVLGRRLDVLASNRLARALYTDFDALPPHFRNMARLIFLHDHVRSVCTDWPAAAQGIVANLRLYAGRYPHDPVLAELVGDLSVRDPDFRRWWADHDVDQHTYGVRNCHHGLVGDLELGYEAFTPTDDPEQTLWVTTVQPRSVSEERLKLLASWAQPAAVDG
ncbi:MAG: Helix-turn-helix protein [Mycobacterium sp.]|jgi:transcriptional regulator with XRE-family HTH domain|nr:Helix-turn-helix protein [Mycobacterium sp.]